MTADTHIAQEELSALADYVMAKGLGTPALFFLEMYKPVTGVIGALGDSFHPLLKMLFGPKRTALALHLVKDRQELDRFLDLLECRLQESRPRRDAHGS